MTNKETPSYLFSQRPKLLTPGPTPVPLAFREVCLKDPIYHRSPEYSEMFVDCRRKLAELFQTRHLPLILTSSGTGALEAALVNFTAEGDHVLVVNGGKFGERWQKLAENYRCQTTTLCVEPGQAVDPNDIQTTLEKQPDIKCLLIQASETSTGVYHPIEEVCRKAKLVNSELIIIVDAVSAICAHDIKMDDWGIDVMVSGSQKGFGIPPGLAFIAVTEKLWNRVSQRPRFYFDLQRERDGQKQGNSAWTSATTLVEQLHAALGHLSETGPEQLSDKHQRLSQACRVALQACGIELFVQDSPSQALTSFLPPYGLATGAISKHLKEQYNVQIAGGQGNLKGKILRLAHLGFVDDFYLIESLSALEFTLADLHPEHEIGTISTAAMRYLHSHRFA